MKQFGAVIFDMDGLLLDTERLALESFRRVCEHLRIGDQTAVFMRCIGTNHAAGWQILEAGLEGKCDVATFARAWDEVHVETAGNAIPVKEGAFELLEQLSAAGIPCGVATSTSTQKAIRKLSDAGLYPRFANVVGGDQVARSKPFPDIYLRAASLLGFQPVDCIAIEDSENGVKAAWAAGTKVIQVPDLVVPSPELLALGHLVFGNLGSVREFLFAH